MSKTLTGRIGLEGMKFRANHGVYPEERVIGGAYIVSVWLEFDINEGETIQKVEDTINYETVYEVAKQVMSEPTPLIETVALKIGNTLRAEFERVSLVEIKVEKLNPPVKGDAQKSTFVIKL